MISEIFIAGIIQGSCHGKAICDQGYRQQLKKLLQKAMPEAKVYCPFEEHPESVHYEAGKAKRVFFELMNHAATADVLVAFLPAASLGTAIELWQAHQAKKIIFTISPLEENWVVKFLPHKNFTCLEEFEAFVTAGEFKRFVEGFEHRTLKEG
jgi:hypothetical protein